MRAVALLLAGCRFGANETADLGGEDDDAGRDR